jgi:hypothetical protein
MSKALAWVVIIAVMAGAAYIGYRYVDERSTAAACAAPSSLDAIYTYLTNNIFWNDPDIKPHVRELVAIDAITFQGYNRETKQIACEGVFVFRSPRFSALQDSRLPFNFSRQPSADTQQYVFKIEKGEAPKDLASWLIATESPSRLIPSKLAAITDWTKVPGLPKAVGECGFTRIKRKDHRLHEGDTGASVPDSGSVVIYENGVEQVSYDEEQYIDDSDVGDQVMLCVYKIQTDCPRDTKPGTDYLAINLRTQTPWLLPNDEHSCLS